MRGSGRGRRHPADPGIPLPADRPPRRRRADRPRGQREEGPVSRAVGHEERARQDRGERQSERAPHRARRFLRLQHAHLRHAGPADHGRDGRAGRVRRHAFGAAAGRTRGIIRGRARLRAGACACCRCGRGRGGVHRDPPRSRQRAVGRAEHAAARPDEGGPRAAEALRPVGKAPGLRPDVTAVMSSSVAVHPLTPDRWNDLVDLFGPERGANSGCWCMWWRMPGTDWKVIPRDEKRDRFRAIVDAGPPPGVLAYDGPTAVGWCAIGPRTTLPRMNALRVAAPLDAVEDVWAVNCFYVRSSYRGAGLMAELLDAATAFA